MAATTADIARLRRMVAEPTATTYDDAALAEVIERYPLMDAAGNAATYDVGSTVVSNGAWVATYDLNAAAAEVWREKAATAIGASATATSGAVQSFTVAGASFTVGEAGTSSSGTISNAERMARFYEARRSVRTITAASDAGSIGSVLL